MKYQLNDLHLFQSAEFARSFLASAYERIHMDQKHAFNNCTPFMYYLEQGSIYLDNAEHTPNQIKPTLLFYGLVQHLKACLLTIDPLYPETTTVLAHGVTSRKRKKQQYTFLKDEVKIQRNGLFMHAATNMFHVKQFLEGEKVSMLTLLQEVPEMNEAFTFYNGEPIRFDCQSNNGWVLSDKVLDTYHMTTTRFNQFMKEKNSLFSSWEKNGDHLIHTHMIPPKNEEKMLPLRYSTASQHWSLPSQLSKWTTVPDLLIHYLILYNLSMISRYETEWWLETLHYRQGNEYGLLTEYIAVATKKINHLISNWLGTKVHDIRGL